MARSIPQHLRVPWKISQAIWVFVAAWILTPIVAVLIIYGLAQVLPLAKELLTAVTDGNIEANFGLDVVSAAAALGLVAMYLRRYKIGWESVGWRKPNLWRTIVYVVGGFFVFFLVVAGVLTLVSLLDPAFNATQAQANEYTDAVTTHRSITLIALVLIPPIIEETVFRGFIFPAIASKWGTWAGAIASSALFGLAHLQANVSVYTFILGLVLCFLYVKLKSIFPGMAIHMLNNFLAYYALASK